MFLVLGGIVTFAAAYLVAMWRRGVRIFNVANSIILAAITYESFGNVRRKEMDRMLTETLAANPRLAFTLDELWQADREAARWRWYSIAFAFHRVWPVSFEPLGWASPSNVARDVRRVRKVLPDFEDRLARRKPYDEYLSRLRRFL